MMLANGLKTISIFFLLCFSITNSLSSQNITLRLTVISGGNISYIFNSIKKYENGISYEDWTKLQIFFNDTTDIGDPGSSTGWELKVKANTSGIMSDGGNLPLPLESIEIRPTSTVTTYNISLTDNFETIAEGLGNQSILEEVLISYDCGVDPDYLMLDQPPDYYYVDLEFKLFPKY